MRRPFQFFILALSLLTTACTQMIWVKNGASRSEFEQMKAACLVEGFQQIPQDERVVQLSDGGYQTTKECTKIKHGERCEKVTEYVPPQYSSYDNNENIRTQVVRACYYRNGWNEVEVK